MENEPVRHFKGVWIPREIWEHPDLTWLEKCMLAEIDSLSRHDKPCSASNGWLGKRFQVSDDRIAHIISDLRKRGFINDGGFNGRIRYLSVTGWQQGSIGGNQQPCLGGNQQWGLVETNKAESSSVCTTENSEREDTRNSLPRRSLGALSPNGPSQPPDQKEFQEYCATQGVPESEAAKCWLYYSARHWLDRNGFVMSWKHLVINWMNRAREKAQLKRDKEQAKEDKKSRVF